MIQPLHRAARPRGLELRGGLPEIQFNATTASKLRTGRERVAAFTSHSAPGWRLRPKVTVKTASQQATYDRKDRRSGSREALATLLLLVIYAGSATIVWSAYDELGPHSLAGATPLAAAEHAALKLPPSAALFGPPVAELEPGESAARPAAARNDYAAAGAPSRMAKLAMQHRITGAAAPLEPSAAAHAAFAVSALPPLEEAPPSGPRPSWKPSDGITVVVSANAPTPTAAAAPPGDAARTAPRPAFKPLVVAAQQPPTQVATVGRRDPLKSFWSSLKALFTARTTLLLASDNDGRAAGFERRSVAAPADLPEPAGGVASDPAAAPAGSTGAATGAGSTSIGSSVSVADDTTSDPSPTGSAPASGGASEGDHEHQGDHGRGGDRGRGDDRGEGGDKGHGGNNGRGGENGKGGNGRGGDNGGGNGRGDGNGRGGRN